MNQEKSSSSSVPLSFKPEWPGGDTGQGRAQPVGEESDSPKIFNNPKTLKILNILYIIDALDLHS